MGCSINCCTDRVSDKRVEDAEPVYINASEWLASVGSRTLSGAVWTTTLPTGAVDNLTISSPQLDRGNNIAMAVLSGGEAGYVYNVEVVLTSCEGYKMTYCFQQAVLQCA